jgi:hypothetical protein
MKGGPESCLYKHVEPKHHAVCATKRCSQDYCDAFISIREIATEDEADYQNDISEDVVRDVGCGKNDRHHHKPEMKDKESVSCQLAVEESRAIRRVHSIYVERGKKILTIRKRLSR